MGLENGIKKTMMAGIGAMATTAEAAKNVVDTLAKKRRSGRPPGKSHERRRKEGGRRNFYGRIEFLNTQSSRLTVSLRRCLS